MKHSSLKTIGSLAAIILLAAGFAFAQAGRGVGRLGGDRLDLEEKPLEGVKLTLAVLRTTQPQVRNDLEQKRRVVVPRPRHGQLEPDRRYHRLYAPGPRRSMSASSRVNPKVTVNLQKVTKGGRHRRRRGHLRHPGKGQPAVQGAKYDEAIASYQQFLEKNPNLYQVQLSIADCYREKGDFDKAIEIYNKVLRTRQDRRRPWARR